MTEKLLEVKDLHTHFYTSDGEVPAVNGISFHLNKGETLAIVGESGCGKSVTSLSVMRLIPDPPGRIVDGQIFFEGEDLLKKSDSAMRKIRGNDISMIFQEPMTSLNPVFTVGDQIAEAVELHQGVSEEKAHKIAVEMLTLVGIPMPEQRAKEYPHQLSGGMRQRVMIAMALSCHPKLLIADEPTTALDVTIQAQILELMKKLRDETGTAIMLITHDLGVVADMAERVIVMYLGKIVEEAPVDDLFHKPLHPYTQGLLNSIPRMDRGKERLHVIEGSVPHPANMPTGCAFNPRCPHVREICLEKMPELIKKEDGHTVRCWLYTEEGQASKAVSKEVSS